MTSIILIIVAFSILGNANFIPNVQCSCQQMIEQKDCSNKADCQWQQIEMDPFNGYCEQKSCQYLTQQQCQLSYSCYYQPGQPGQEFCFPFKKCQDLVLAANQTCQEANVKCVPSNQLNPQCIPGGYSCSSLETQETCQPAKGFTLAGEGLCYWNGQSCKVITNCGEVQTQTQCEMQFLNRACLWTGQTCVAQQCSNFSSGNCTYILNNPMSGSAIQPCFWNIDDQTCTPTNANQLTLEDCAKNTDFHYRWAPINTIQGICAECNSQKFIYRNQCECKQLLQQQECMSSPGCIWEPSQNGQFGSCLQNTCINITNQQTCAQIQGCYWNTSIASSVCTVFSSCSAILGKNSQACLQQSIFCPGSNGKNCLNQFSMLSCSELQKEPNICYNSIGKDGYCIYNVSTNECQNLTSCGILTSIQQCNQFAHSCIWNANTYECQQKTCSNYLTKESCNFVQNSLNINVLNICSWNSDTKICYAYDNSLKYDINTCFNQTGRTHHWSEPLNASNGLCLPCRYSSLLNIKSDCSCSDLINYTDCALSSPKCFWNSTATTKCQKQVCTQLTNQGSCAISKNCYWNISNNKASCQNINQTDTTCATIKANTQQECLSQSILCAGINNGYCSSTLNSCSEYQTFYQCFGSVGTDGICQWNQTQTTCLGINNCNMITTEIQCSLLLNTCYWQTLNGNSSCTPYNCSTLYAQTNNCDFYLSTPNQNYEINLCYLEGLSCNSAHKSLINLTSSNCYASSGGTARWNASGTGTCQLCYTQIISILFLVLIYMN
ncbi:unnamed protein product [Paramecium sonneborni]|uniref:Uncharacterized protein n=1 Tax=Paramecium sonneborni TaxID=65129 RepID=A0A8S1K0S8_9CILI|nr:unnamed protein product [Paramecium sonneborni]